MFSLRPLSILPTLNPLEKTTRVALLGDAAHPMTMDAGVGANTELRNALKLATARKQEDSWPQAVSEYETNMFKRGFAAVQKLFRLTQMFHSQGYSALAWY
jgi:2-polyprenyl-6-methoxyphenol hydroxylase-like FAD-dependent oxidoreductase